MISKHLIKWYEKNKRDLPWRNTKDPYLIWLSEIILQQTRVDQGMPYYLKFIENFPTVKHLSKAPEEKVLKLWQGLGYYSRARNLHFTAKLITEKYKGVFPTEFEEIKKLKGVGDYTAAAIASFAYNKPYAVLDGNVFRVLSRLFEIKTPINSTKGKNEFLEVAQELLDKKNPASYNQAIMELGARVCKPQNPHCEGCCLRTYCYSYKNKTTANFPVKENKIKMRNRYFYYLVITDKKSNIVLNKRTQSDIWQGLHDFPLIEHAQSVAEEKIISSKEFKKIINKRNIIGKVSPYFVHQLSHQKIHAKFIEVNVQSCAEIKSMSSYFSAPLKILDKYAIPRLVDKFLEQGPIK